MFGFGWVRTHLGVVFGDACGLFWGFLVGFLEKGTKSTKSGQLRGPTPRHRDPYAAA